MSAAEDLKEFIEEVGRLKPADATEFGEIAASLIRWSEEHDWVLQHAPANAQVQAVVKFEIAGMDAPFWAAYPRQADGAKLSILDSDSVFPAQLVADARVALAELDGREPKANERPTVSFQRLQSPEVRRQVKRLLCRLLVQMGHHEQ